MLDTSLKTANTKVLHEIAVDHKVRVSLNSYCELKAHKCSWGCLIRSADAVLADEGYGDERTVQRRKYHLPSPFSAKLTYFTAYATYLSDDEKTECLHFFLMNSLQDADTVRIISLALEHGIAVN